jgi:hypothetical protein
MDQECVGPPLRKACKGRVDVAIGADGENFNLLSNRRSLRVFYQGFSIRIVRINE